ncbi:predicted protein [Naegleria gruberi]|uniref:Predicted protein n=1 Tax=Naegleria gruberi TaxID=5762 RepID=D2VD02_NAEGR|nr:uncharacterized protein NAEGRDRAFT_66749 [Naegleria gruberi]EFC45510.1 predicted protein [Naegleria gruberi]|eukprot:XP_002678254.1 predicted protein [Naegleria gruberi strain NEG-M]
MPLLTSSNYEGYGERSQASSPARNSALKNHHTGDDPTIMHLESTKNGFSRLFVSKPSPYAEHSSSSSNRYAPSPTNSRPTVFSSKTSTPTTYATNNPSLSPSLTLLNDAERPTSSLAINHTPGHFSAIKFQRQIPSLSPSSPRASSTQYRTTNEYSPSTATLSNNNTEQYVPHTNPEKNRPRSPSTNFAPETQTFDPAIFRRRAASPTVFNTSSNNNKAAVEEHHHYYYLANKEKIGTQQQRMRRESPTLTPRDREMYISKSPHPFLSTMSRANTTPSTAYFTPPSFKPYDFESEQKSGRQSGISVGMKEIEISPRKEKEDLIKQLLLSEKTDKAFKMAEVQQEKIKNVQNSYFTEEFATSDIEPIKISTSRPKKTSIIFNNHDEGNTTDNEDREIVNILSQIKKSRTAINENTNVKPQITPKKESPMKQNISFGEDKQDFIRRNMSSTIKDVNNLLTLVETDGLETSQSKLFNQQISTEGDLLTLSSMLTQQTDTLKNRLTERYAGQLGDCLTQ